MQLIPKTAVKSRSGLVLLLTAAFLMVSLSDASAASHHRRPQGPLAWLFGLQHKPPVHTRRRKPSKLPRKQTAPAIQTAAPSAPPAQTPTIAPKLGTLEKKTEGEPNGAGADALPVPTPRPGEAAPAAVAQPPVEPARPEPQAESRPAADEVPTPTPRPDAAALPPGEPSEVEPTAQEPQAEPAADAVPTPTPRPDAAALPSGEPSEVEPTAPEPQAEPAAEPEIAVPTPRPEQPTPVAIPKPEKPFVQAIAPVVTPEQEEACRTALRGLGVVFSESPPQSDPLGCRMDRPISVSALSPSIKLSPAVVMICPLAETLARFSQTVIAPAAQKSFGSPLASLPQASSYVCRGRHGSHKLSEHAFGNAIDIMSMKLADGRDIPVKAETDPVRLEFLDSIRRAACGPFKTVLGPGSDPDHALHFHLDLEQRRNGATYCH